MWCLYYSMLSTRGASVILDTFSQRHNPSNLFRCHALEIYHQWFLATVQLVVTSVYSHRSREMLFDSQGNVSISSPDHENPRSLWKAPLDSSHACVHSDCNGPERYRGCLFAIRLVLYSGSSLSICVSFNGSSSQDRKGQTRRIQRPPLTLGVSRTSRMPSTHPHFFFDARRIFLLKCYRGLRLYPHLTSLK